MESTRSMPQDRLEGSAKKPLPQPFPFRLGEIGGLLPYMPDGTKSLQVTMDGLKPYLTAETLKNLLPYSLDPKMLSSALRPEFFNVIPHGFPVDLPKAEKSREKTEVSKVQKSFEANNNTRKTVVPEPVKMPSVAPTQLANPHHDANLAKAIRELYSDEFGLDVVILADGGHVSAHCAVLASASHFLKSLLLHTNDHPVFITITDVSLNTVKTLISFLYTGVVPRGANLNSLIDAAKVLHMNSIVKILKKSDPARNDFLPSGSSHCYEAESRYNIPGQSNELKLEKPAKKEKSSRLDQILYQKLNVDHLAPELGVMIDPQKGILGELLTKTNFVPHFQMPFSYIDPYAGKPIAPLNLSKTNRSEAPVSQNCVQTSITKTSHSQVTSLPNVTGTLQSNTTAGGVTTTVTSPIASTLPSSVSTSLPGLTSVNFPGFALGSGMGGMLSFPPTNLTTLINPTALASFSSSMALSTFGNPIIATSGDPKTKASVMSSAKPKPVIGNNCKLPVVSKKNTSINASALTTSVTTSHHTLPLLYTLKSGPLTQDMLNEVYEQLKSSPQLASLAGMSSVPNLSSLSPTTTNSVQEFPKLLTGLPNTSIIPLQTSIANTSDAVKAKSIDVSFRESIKDVDSDNGVLNLSNPNSLKTEDFTQRTSPEASEVLPVTPVASTENNDHEAAISVPAVCTTASLTECLNENCENTKSEAPTTEDQQVQTIQQINYIEYKSSDANYASLIPKSLPTDYSIKVQQQMGRKRKGCGDCDGCLVVEDCGDCRFCKDKAKFGGPNRLKQVCLNKRCIHMDGDLDEYRKRRKLNKKHRSRCKACDGCQRTTDCGECYACLHNAAAVAPGRKKICEMRVCEQQQMEEVRAALHTAEPSPYSTDSIITEGIVNSGTSSPSAESVNSITGERKASKKSKNSLNRVSPSKVRTKYYCGECPGCQTTVPCGRCLYCEDMPKFGGPGRYRQKCVKQLCVYHPRLQALKLSNRAKVPLDEHFSYMEAAAGSRSGTPQESALDIAQSDRICSPKIEQSVKEELVASKEVLDIYSHNGQQIISPLVSTSTDQPHIKILIKESQVTVKDSSPLNLEKLETVPEHFLHPQTQLTIKEEEWNVNDTGAYVDHGLGDSDSELDSHSLESPHAMSVRTDMIQHSSNVPVEIRKTNNESHYSDDHSDDDDEYAFNDNLSEDEENSFVGNAISYRQENTRRRKPQLTAQPVINKGSSSESENEFERGNEQANNKVSCLTSTASDNVYSCHTAWSVNDSIG